MSVIRLCYLDTILLQNLFANIDDCSTDSVVALSLSYILNIKFSYGLYGTCIVLTVEVICRIEVMSELPGRRKKLIFSFNFFFTLGSTRGYAWR